MVSTPTSCERKGFYVEMKVKSTRPVWANLARFERSQYAVYQVPLKTLQRFVGIGPDYVYSATMHDWPGGRLQLDNVGSGSMLTAPTGVVSETSAIDEEKRGRSLRRARRRERSSSRDRRRHLAIDKAEKSGVRIPPGFELRSVTPSGSSQQPPEDTTGLAIESSVGLEVPREEGNMSIIRIPSQVTDLDGYSFMYDEEKVKE